MKTNWGWPWLHAVLREQQPHRDKNVDLSPNEFNRIAIEALVLFIGKGVHYRNIATFNIAKSA